MPIATRSNLLKAKPNSTGDEAGFRRCVTAGVPPFLSTCTDDLPATGREHTVTHHRAIEDLVRDAQAGVPDAGNALITRMDRDIRRATRRAGFSAQEFEEAVAFAYEIVWEAVRSYDPQRRTGQSGFIAHATTLIRLRLQDRRQDFASPNGLPLAVPRHAAREGAFDDLPRRVDVDAAGELRGCDGDPLLLMLRSAQHARVRAAVDALPPRQRDVIVRLFGIGVPPTREHDLAQEWNTSRHAVAALRQRALQRLAQAPVDV